MHKSKTKDNDGLRNFSMKMPKEIWEFLRRNSIDTDESMAGIIIKCVAKYKKKWDSKAD